MNILYTHHKHRGGGDGGREGGREKIMKFLSLYRNVFDYIGVILLNYGTIEVSSSQRQKLKK